MEAYVQVHGMRCLILGVSWVEMAFGRQTVGGVVGEFRSTKEPARTIGNQQDISGLCLETLT